MLFCPIQPGKSVGETPCPMEKTTGSFEDRTRNLLSEPGALPLSHLTRLTKAQSPKRPFTSIPILASQQIISVMRAGQRYMTVGEIRSVRGVDEIWMQNE